VADVVSQSVVTGVVLQLVIGGVTIGLAQEVEGRRQFNTEPIWGTGCFLPQDIVMQRYVGQISVSRFFIRYADLESLGLVGLGDDVLRMGLIDIEVHDTRVQEAVGISTINPEGTSGKTDRILRTYQNCICFDYVETFRANAIAGERASWFFQKCVSEAGSTKGTFQKT
jgi:hypothetical protein